MTTPDTSDEALALVQRGWEHRKLQRPLAAWACWQRALRLSPDDPAATEALDRLAMAGDLPAAARATYRFRPPRGEERRSRWDERLRERDMDDLRVAAATFGELADADARYNQALCLAWLGENVGAIAALDRVVSIEAAESPESAVEAWTLAEVLRQGAGAEHLCDDLSHTLVIDWPDDLGDPIEWLSSFAALKEMPPPIDPTSRQPVLAGARVFEWLEGPLPSPSPDLTADHLPRVWASVIATPGELRLSSPVVRHLERVERLLRGALWGREVNFDRRSTPLPFALMDGAVWSFRIPEGLDEAARQRLLREAVERFFEDDWIHSPRYGLGGPRPEGAGSDWIYAPPAELGDHSVLVEPATPLSAYQFVADQSAGASDAAVARAKLEAVIRVREQLAARPRVAPLYGGYPFDRLRRRLGLEPIDPATVDPADVSCMSEAELAKLDPSALDEPTLIEAYRSAVSIEPSHAPPAARLATALARRDPSALLRVDPPRLAEDVILSASYDEGPERALEWIDRAVALTETAGARHRGTLELLRGHVLDNAGDREAAARQYRSLLDRFPDDVRLLMMTVSQLDGVGDEEGAIPLLRRVVERSRETGDRVHEGTARAWLDRLWQKGLT